MKNVLTLIMLLLSYTASGTIYYISPSGSNSNNGSSSSPWKTLSYACSKATNSGDVIHITPGTYIEIAQSRLAVGVSIEGAGINSVIKSRIGGSSFTLLLQSSTEGTNGNQHISNILMDGSALIAYGAIKVLNRSNVEIYNCTFVDFNYYGVSFYGGEPPSVYSKGNKFHDNKVTNCSGYFPHADKTGGEGKFALGIDGQQSMYIYNNTLDQTSRAPGDNGYLIKAVKGYNKDIKIYNNIITKAPYDGLTWDFAIELWFSKGGIEIYDNIIKGGSVDCVVSEKGTYDYALYIHDNTIGNTLLGNLEAVRGILLEREHSDVIIEKNHIKNVTAGIYLDQFGSARTVNNIRISYNILDNIGQNDVGTNQKGWGILWTIEDYRNHIVNNINILNNVIISHDGARSTMYGIGLPDIGVVTNVSVKNNIIQGFDYSPVFAYGGGGTNINILSIENNIFFQNGNSNLPRYNGITPTQNTTRNNIVSNPLFVSSVDFHLQSGSPAIGKGLTISGLTTDFAGTALKIPPSIGAYESGTTTPPPALPVYQSSVVENATPSLLTMTYNLTLANIVPVASAFTVRVNSVARTVNAVVISGTKVQLTLASPVVYGNTVTVSYTKPATNPLQTTAGGQAVTISAQAVTNKVLSNIPVYVSSAVENATPAILTMTYNQTLAKIAPAASAFSVQVNSVVRTVNAVAVSGTKVQLTLASNIVTGDVVRVSYIKPLTNPIQNASGGAAASITSQSVINNCTNNFSPAATITSPVNNSSFTAPTSITITANAVDSDGSVSLVEFYSDTTKLGSVSAAPYTFNWDNVTPGVYSLTVIATDNLNAKSTSPEISVTVIDDKSAVNNAPTITISNPTKGNTYENLTTITIEAIVNDTDGTIARVEFFNGLVRLVELTSAPYSYTWKDIPTGRYSITGVATDNLNASTTSSSIEFEVGAPPKEISTPVKYDGNSEIINLYPNPNDGHFSIDILDPLQNERSEIIITDMAGKQVYQGPVLKEEVSKQFDLSKSKSGIYVMLIKDKEIIITKKFIKKK